MKTRTQRAFTIVELLVVVSIIGLLVGILLPAIGKARDQAKVTISQANLRNMGTAHASYGAEWADRQLTLVVDSIATYGTDTAEAYAEYARQHGEDQIGDDAWHPPIYLGWGHGDGDLYYLFRYYQAPGQIANNSLTQPIVFSGTLEGFGSFRLANCRQFAQYVGGRFYDPVFYAPKDKAVIAAASQCFESPDEYCTYADVSEGLGSIPAWSSYVLSPAAMFNPSVMRHNDPEDPTANGWVDPWDMPAGFRSPSFSQALFPSLKTHMLEHHWLQNAQAECNPTFDPGTYANCEPYYFNHGWESSPMTLFYDGHVEGVGVRKSMRTDGRMRQQTGSQDWGLWSKDTDLGGEDGYFSDLGYDQAQSSFHILTTDGIRGRDIVGD